MIEQDTPSYEIRAPWPDEISRAKQFLRGYRPENRSLLRIAVVGRWERIVGVAALEEGANEEELCLQIRPRFLGTALETELKEAVLAARL